MCPPLANRSSADLHFSVRRRCDGPGADRLRGGRLIRRWRLLARRSPSRARTAITAAATSTATLDAASTPRRLPGRPPSGGWAVRPVGAARLAGTAWVVGAARLLGRSSGVGEFGGSGWSGGLGVSARAAYGPGSGGSWSKTSIGSPSSVNAGSFNGSARSGASAASASLAEGVRSAASGCARPSTTAHRTLSSAASAGRLGGGRWPVVPSPVRSCQPVTPAAYRSWLMEGGSPASASGATYPGVPTTAPCWVRRGSPSDNAMPKSLSRSTGAGTGDLEQEVRRLDVPVDEPGGVDMIERGQQLRQQFGGIAFRQGAEVGDQTTHRTAADQIHGQQRLIVLGDPAVWAQHCGRSTRSPLLTNEPKQGSRMPLARHLRGAEPLQPPVPGPPDQTVATGTNRVDELVPSGKHVDHHDPLSPGPEHPTIDQVRRPPRARPPPPLSTSLRLWALPPTLVKRSCVSAWFGDPDTRRLRRGRPPAVPPQEPQRATAATATPACPSPPKAELVVTRGRRPRDGALVVRRRRSAVVRPRNQRRYESERGPRRPCTIAPAGISESRVLSRINSSSFVRSSWAGCQGRSR